jgi:hypothetical protein
MANPKYPFVLDATQPLVWPQKPDPRPTGEQSRSALRECRICGCTEGKPCANGCYWFEPDLCSECAEFRSLLREYLDISKISKDAVARLYEEAVALEPVTEPSLDDIFGHGAEQPVIVFTPDFDLLFPELATEVSSNDVPSNEPN